MDQKKKDIILNEIEHWRKNKLLPGQYCDFLFNLYSDDSKGIPNPQTSILSGGSGSRALGWMGSSRKFTFIYCVVISFLFSLIAVHFTSFWPALQIGLLTFGVIFLYAVGLRRKSDAPLISISAMGLGSILLLIGGEWRVEAFLTVSSAAWAAMYLLFASVIWLITGIFGRMGYMQFCGCGGILICYSWWVIQDYHPEHWLVEQLFWVPISLICAFLSMLTIRRGLAVGRMLFILFQGVWFLPELYAWGVTQQELLPVQISFGIKIIMDLAALIFLLRQTKKWTA